MTVLRMGLPGDMSLDLYRVADGATMTVREDRPGSYHVARMLLSKSDMRRLRDWLDMALGVGTSLLCPPDCPLCGKPLRAYGLDEWSCPGCGIRIDRRDPGYE